MSGWVQINPVFKPATNISLRTLSCMKLDYGLDMNT